MHINNQCVCLGKLAAMPHGSAHGTANESNGYAYGNQPATPRQRAVIPIPLLQCDTASPYSDNTG